jgi:adenylate cyclase
MGRGFLHWLIGLLARIGARPDDDDEQRSRRMLTMGAGVLGMLISLFWGSLHVIWGDAVAGWVWIGAAGIYMLLACLVHWQIIALDTGRILGTMMVLILPFWQHLSMGGLIASSEVILWMLLAPLLNLILTEPRRVILWIGAYFALLTSAVLLEPYFPPTRLLPNDVITGFFLINHAVLSWFILIILYYFVMQRRLFQERSDVLLLNIFPAEIAAILKRQPQVIADHFESASVLFADIVNFTPLSAHMTPVELVEMLNEIFSCFDQLVEKYGVEKIKTIGDCYMVAAGVPRPCSDHAHILTRMALEMRAVAAQQTFQGHQVSFRIGINSGPVVAGVIGKKKFIYDLWGDAVNTASRMESHGGSGLIQISRGTYDLIHHEFLCEPRGVAMIKGKGEMDLWHVTGERA